MEKIEKTTTIKVVDKKDKIKIIRTVDYGNYGYDQEIGIEKSYIPDLIKTLQKVIGE